MNKIILCLLAISLSVSAGAQEVYNSSGNGPGRNQYAKKKKTGFDPQRLVIGGAPVLGFGSGYLALGVAPVVGYRFTERFLAGVGLSYTYNRQKDFYQFASGDSYDLKLHTYSGSVWARYLVFDNIFAHAELEQDFTRYSYTADDPYNPGSFRTEWINYHSPALLLGGGYRSPISTNASFVAMLLYDVLQDKYSPYFGGPSIRVGVNVGF